MAYMSRNNSASSLMGFSVHQPQLGAMLEFFPAMGTQQLDEMIDAYVPGNLSILDKRTAVTMEFFEHSVATGELFKFFMVYPATTADSPANSLQDSGYGSAFASPVVSEPRWSASTSKKARIGNTSTKDFSHIPGMKIMTRDGQDVTNSASRGCKTKEQRDHAHLMRIMKACDVCKKKKVRCDPSHKRTAAPAAADSKVKKATKKSSSSSRTVPASVPPINTVQNIDTTSFDTIMPSFDISEQDSWEQFVVYDQEDFAAAPSIDVNYDFFYDPAGHFSPSASFTSGFNSGSSSNSASPSQPFTPSQSAVVPSGAQQRAGLADGEIAKDAYGSHNMLALGELGAPSLPYESDGVDGSNYVDFALFSPESTGSLDDDLSSYSQELKATSSPVEQVYSGSVNGALQHVSGSRGASSSPVVTTPSAALESSSAFAHLEQCSFDRSTEQRGQLITGVFHGRRRRVLAAAYDSNGNTDLAVTSRDLAGTGERCTSESSVPCRPQHVPRPPASPASSALTVMKSDAAAQSSAPMATSSIRRGISAGTEQLTLKAIVATTQADLHSQQSPGNAQQYVSTPIARAPLVTGYVATIMNEVETKQYLIEETIGSDVVSHNTTLSTSQGSIVPFGNENPSARTLETSAEVITSHVYNTRRDTTGQNVLGHRLEARSPSTLAEQADSQPLTSEHGTSSDLVTVSPSHRAASQGGRTPLSSRSISDLGYLSQSQQSSTAPVEDANTIVAIFVLSALAATLVHTTLVRHSTSFADLLFGFAAIAALSAKALRTGPYLMKLQPTAGPLKSTTTSSSDAKLQAQTCTGSIFEMLNAKFGNIECLFAGSVQSLVRFDKSVMVPSQTSRSIRRGMNSSLMVDVVSLR